MSTLSPDRIADLLVPYLEEPASPELCRQLSLYLDLLLRWNARTNLTAVRDPEVIVIRHFGESLFGARLLPPEVRTVLDLGSGAGFPGLPLHLLRPDLSVALTEAQGKKVAFLREMVRSLELPTRVVAGRAETLTETFDLVTLRAVDDMTLSLALAQKLSHGPVLAYLSEEARVRWSPEAEFLMIPGTSHRTVVLSTADTLRKG